MLWRDRIYQSSRNAKHKVRCITHAKLRVPMPAMRKPIAQLQRSAKFAYAHTCLFERGQDVAV